MTEVEALNDALQTRVAQLETSNNALQEWVDWIRHGVRLVGGDSINEGRLEVYYNREWGTVCDDLFDNNDAQVVCRQLGYSNGVALSKAAFGQGTGRVWLDQVACHGSEANIKDCGHGGWGVHDCSHSEDVGVRCSA